MLTKIAIKLILLIGTCRTQNYFCYDDCPRKCIDQSTDCVIYESQDNFIRECITSDESCLQQSSRKVVCLRPNLPLSGGDDIWEQFREKYHPSVTTETPNNEDESKLFHLAITAGGALLGMTTILVITILCMLHRSSMNNGYEPINPSPETSIATEFPNPYQSTVETI